jgi:toxin ParE1/3/4
MTRFTLSPEAEHDLAEIWLYTADNWGVDQADRYVLGIKDDLANAGPDSPVVRPIDGLWRLKSSHHLCIFRRDEDGEVFVVRVLHERMDVARHLPG